MTPLPPGVGLNTPAPNLYAASVTAAVTNNPPAPVAVNPPRAAEAPVAQQVVYTSGVQEQPPVTVNYFYNELSPYGSWVEVAGYGRCWRPTVAVWNSSWRPYCDGGRWLWSDSGWYWYSDYSWGWAPFHYGRWSCPAGIGWVWTPDTCWGPAWVSWRNSSAYCGWAPLPPSARFIAGHGFYHNGLSVDVGFHFGLGAADFIFLPFSHFCEPRLSAHRLSATHANAVYRESKVVNNAISVNKATVNNNGIAYDRIAAATRGNVRRVALKDTAEVRDTTTRREVLDADGKTLSVYRPSAAALAARPTTASTILHPRPQVRTSDSSASAFTAAGRGNDAPVSGASGLSGQTRPLTGSTFLSPRPATAGTPAASSVKPAGTTLARTDNPPAPVKVGEQPRSITPNTPTPTPPSGRPNTVIVRTEPARNYVQPAPVAGSPVIHAPSAQATGPRGVTVQPEGGRSYAPPVAVPSAPSGHSAPIHAAPVSRGEGYRPQPSPSPRSEPSPRSSSAESGTRATRSSGDDSGRRGGR